MSKVIPDIHAEALTVAFRSPDGLIPALENLDFDLMPGETVAIMGETGCGKSVFGLACMRLLDDIAEVSGLLEFKGKNIYDFDGPALRLLQGKRISLVPQSASSAFDPVMKIGRQITEFIEKCGVATRDNSRQRAMEYLSRVGFESPEDIFNSYPHRLSGGMNERALIAMAVSVEPEIIIADEPTKGLDTHSKNDVLRLLQEISRDTSMLLITHDFKTAEICEKTAIMYSGQVIEYGPTEEILKDPWHYYTKGLIAAHPANGMRAIPGQHRLEDRSAQGCRFRERCSAAEAECRTPPSMQTHGGRQVRCHYA